MVGAASAAVLAVGLSVAGAVPAHADATTPGSYNTVQATRVLDTRSGIGAPKATVGPLGVVTFTIPAGPSGPVGSVLMEVTVVNPTAAGYATVYPAGTPRPTVSNVNYPIGQNVPDMVVVKVGTGSKVSIFNGSFGSVDLLADVQGYFLDGANTGVPGTFVPQTPARFLDTRSGQGATVKGQVKPYSTTKLQIAGRGGVPATASAVAVNVTAVGSGGKGFITAYAGSPRPDSSSLNYEANQNRANLAFVEMGTDGTISLYNGSPFPVDLLADVSGYFVGGGDAATDGSFTPSSTFRVADSRLAADDRIPALSTVLVPIFPGGGVSSVIKAVAVNVTVVNPEAAGFLTTWDGTTSVPAVSNSNFQPKHDVAGSIVVPVNDDGSISIYNGSFGTLDLVVDFDGVFSAVPPGPSPDAARSGRTVAQLIAAAKKFAGTPHHLTVIPTR